MPIFEFVCTSCGESFEELMRSASAVEEAICPSCGSSQVKKQISTFSARLSGAGFTSNFPSASASCSTRST
ncbi:MAG TPA: zinc ribbon domain-containing protein [Anaerolineales bacterium]|nr:zinc ribbon domain-containing protein [Anaerolineales bacterium]